MQRTLRSRQGMIVLIILSLMLALAAVATSSQPAQATPTTVAFNPTDDAYVESGANAAVNFGSATTLSMGASAGTPNVLSYLKFNVSVPAGKTITSASLKLRVFSGSATGYTIRTSANTTWSESLLTWNNAPSVPTTPESAASGAVTAGTDSTVSVTSLLPAQGGAATLVLRTTGSRFSVRSKENGTTIPELSVTYDNATTSPTTTSFVATEDDYISAANPTTNNGATDTLRTSDNASKIRSLIKFNLTGVSGHITAATLKLYVKGGQTLTAVAQYKVVGMTNTAWDENTVTYNTRPPTNYASAVTSAALNTANVATTGHYENVDVLSLMPGTPSGNVSVSIECTCTNSGGINFHSSENADSPSRKPTLDLTTDSMVADPVIAAAGDIACPTTNSDYHSGAGADGYCHQQYTANVVTGDPLITDVLTLGDHQYENNTETQFTNAYQPYWGKFWGKTHPVIGNHEYQYPSGQPGDGTAAGYFGYFLDKSSGAVSDTSTSQSADCVSACKGYYSYDIGTWHVVVLNANCNYDSNNDLGTGACASGSTQGTWLASDLSANSQSCTLVTWHQPRWSSAGHGNYTNSNDFTKIAYNNGADLILSGHEHSYERFAPLRPPTTSGDGTADALTGVREFVVGPGGRNHEAEPGSFKTGSENFIGDVFGVLKLTLHPGSYDYNFTPEAGNPGGLAAPVAGSPILDGTPESDTGTGLCHGLPATTVS